MKTPTMLVLLRGVFLVKGNDLAYELCICKTQDINEALQCFDSRSGLEIDGFFIRILIADTQKFQKEIETFKNPTETENGQYSIAYVTQTDAYGWDIMRHPKSGKRLDTSIVLSAREQILEFGREQTFLKKKKRFT